MSNLLKDTAAKTANLIHRTLVDVTGGRIGGTVGGMPTLKLTTNGRKSGEARTVMLTTPVQRDGDIVIVASYGGDEKHPAWYLNLQADPNVTIEMDGEMINAIARTATADERAELWPDITSVYKGYGGYQTKTDREIPVVICSPA